MKVKILKSCSGYNYSFKQGDVVEVKDFIGKDLIHAGYAVAENITQSEKSIEKTQTELKKRNSKIKESVSEDAAD